MLSTKKAFSRLSDEEYQKALDLPVWISLLAAYAHDGVISKHERAEAVRIAYLKTFTAPHDLLEYTRQVYRNFDRRFDELNRQLSGNLAEKSEYIKKRVHEAFALLPKLDKSVREDLLETLESFYRHVFMSDRSFIQYFALPAASGAFEDVVKNEGLGDMDS